MADSDTEKRRLFIGGLHHELKEGDLKERFGRHGSISSLKLRTKKDTKGNPIKTFAHMDIVLTDKELKKCMSIYNNTKWNGNTMQIQLAKESVLTRLERERTAVCTLSEEEVVVRPKKPSHQAAAMKRLEENFEKAGVSEFVVKGKVPGTQIEGEKNWIVGKYGRVLPVVYIRRKDKQKVVCYDPSKFSHHLRKFKDDDKVDEGIGMAKVEKLTWDLPESNSDVSLKRKGIFQQARPLMPQRKKVKDDLVMKKDQLGHGKGPECGVPKRGVDSYCSGQSDSDFEDKDDDRFPTNEDRVQMNSGGAKQSTDFEIVRDSASPFSQKAKSNTLTFESEHGYDSDDRDSVDTDELCTLVRSSKKSSGSQTNGVLKRKEASKTALPTGDRQAVTTKMKRVKKAHKQEEESDMCEQGEINDDEKINVTKTEHFSAEVVESGTDSDNDDIDSLNGDDTTDSEQHEHSEEEEEMSDRNNDKDGMDISKQDDNYSNDDGPVPSLNFDPLILDRSHLQGHKDANDLSKYPDDDEQEEEEEDEEDDEEEEEEDEEDEEEEDSDDHNESDIGEVETATQDSDEEDDDQETLGSPIARFDFQPLILDRAAMTERIGTETNGDQPDLECYAEEKKEDSDDSETDRDIDESDEEDKSSDESSDAGEDHIEESDNTESDERSDNTLNNIKEIKKSTDKEGTSKTLPVVKPSATVIDVEKPPAELQLKKDKFSQDMYDKSGRLLSKAAKRKLAREEAEKQRQADERRLESMKRQQRALLDRQVAIKGALSAVDDKDKKQGKHITFDSEDEDPESDTGAGNDETMIAGQKIPGKISLFESDSDDEEGSVTENTVKKMWEDDDDDDDDDDEDDERFKIKPQYEGEAGQKLIQMEARYGGDTRFKLDTRFMDKENESAGTGAKAEVKENTEDDPSSSDLQEEKRKSLAILQNMLGTPVVASSKPVEPNFKDPSQLHYDPSRDEHSKYELREADTEESDAKKIEEEVRKEKRKMEEERAKLPEVSKEKFFQVSSNLKDAFSGGGGGRGGLEEEEDRDGGEGDGGTFTFFGGDVSDGEDEAPQTKMDENVNTDLASSLITSKRFKYDSSDDEDDDEDDDDTEGEEGMEVDSEKIKAKNVAEEESENTSVPQAFFFLPDDPRLTAGSQKFCRPKDRDAMMTMWEEMKAQLQNDFRKRHQKAVRDQKTSKKWQKKPVKSF